MQAAHIEVPMKNNQETRIALLEQSILYSTKGVERIEQHLYKMEQHIDKMNDKIDRINQRLWTNFYWTLATMFTLSSVGAGILAKGFGWLT